MNNVYPDTCYAMCAYVSTRILTSEFVTAPTILIVGFYAFTNAFRPNATIVGLPVTFNTLRYGHSRSNQLYQVQMTEYNRLA